MKKVIEKRGLKKRHDIDENNIISDSSESNNDYSI